MDAEGGKILDASRYSQSLKRGFHMSTGTTEEALKRALAEDIKHNKIVPAILLLDAQGQHIDEICPQLLEFARQGVDAGACR